MQWLLTAHVRHYQRHDGGSGHVWQRRFKAFPVSGDENLLAACRYAERNAPRANLVARAEHWRWGSRAQFVKPTDERPSLSEWPIERPRDWVKRVNAALSPPEEEAFQRSLLPSLPILCAWPSILHIE